MRPGTRLEPLEIEVASGTTLRGLMAHAGELWTVLIHDEGTDLDAWVPLTAQIVNRGISALLLDLRGHGLSDGDWSESTFSEDLEAALSFVRRSGGRPAVIGAIGRCATLALQSMPKAHVEGIILISPVIHRLDNFDNPRFRGVGRLVIAGTLDTTMDKGIRLLKRRLVGPTIVVNLPTKIQGAQLLEDPWGRVTADYTLRFISRCANKARVPNEVTL